ncbi:sporulation integral membrane protein YtvI [Bacillus sp. 1NLA3E]|uniref:sporulation integral membrane protein YtvI n=1 Tax=Bacillus sp. 1NLA3E TaxID=666686 RepID=UPI0002D51C4C|nr:sporulation integral membrane protein YtvI [Bacillus sp. 1NLA3E]AGK52501.1 sporulation integral membrane protein YtvI [Bacillus sp. 1NLA3E]
MWKKWIFVFLGVVLAIFILPHSLPLIFALLTALLLEGLVSWLIEKLRFSRLQSVIAVFTGYVLMLVVIGYNTIAIITTQTVTLSEKTPTFVKDLYRSAIKPLIKKWESYSQSLPKDVIGSIENTVENSINSLDSFMQGMVQAIINFLTVIPGFLIEFLIYLVALFLISLELPKLKVKLDNYLTDQTKKKFYLVTTQLSKAGIGFIKAQIILSFITFTMAFVGLTILRVPYTALLSLLIVVVDILPILGTGSVLVPWAVVAILQDNSFLGIGLIILFFVITIVRRIIEPKVYSSSLGISPLASLISLYIGFKLLGIVGVFLGPAVVIVYDTLKKANIIKMNFKI